MQLSQNCDFVFTNLHWPAVTATATAAYCNSIKPLSIFFRSIMLQKLPVNAIIEMAFVIRLGPGSFDCLNTMITITVDCLWSIKSSNFKICYYMYVWTFSGLPNNVFPSNIFSLIHNKKNLSVILTWNLIQENIDKART